jgi:hypothetical protein
VILGNAAGYPPSVRAGPLNKEQDVPECKYSDNVGESCVPYRISPRLFLSFTIGSLCSESTQSEMDTLSY